MQRRAAAVYFALFIVIGAGASAFLATSSQPPIRLDGPTYSDGDDLAVGGVTYTVNATGAGGYALEWFNDSHRASTTLENGSTTDFRGGNYSVVVDNETEPRTVSLVEEHNVTALLGADPAVEDEVAVQDGERYVFYTNGSRQRLSAYLPEPDRSGPHPPGATLEWPVDDETVTATVDRVSNTSARLSWPAPRDESIPLEEGGNVTLGATTHFAHFPEAGGVQVLPTDEHWEAYRDDLELREQYHERRAGLWAILILSFLAAIILLATAYLPVRG